MGAVYWTETSAYIRGNHEENILYEKYFQSRKKRAKLVLSTVNMYVFLLALLLT